MVYLGKCLCHPRCVATTGPAFCFFCNDLTQSHCNTSLFLGFSTNKPFFSQLFAQNSSIQPKMDVKADGKCSLIDHTIWPTMPHLCPTLLIVSCLFNRAAGVEWATERGRCLIFTREFKCIVFVPVLSACGVVGLTVLFCDKLGS